MRSARGGKPGPPRRRTVDACSRRNDGAEPKTYAGLWITNEETNMSGSAIDYARMENGKHLSEFFEFLRIQSISTDKAFAQDVRAAAEWLVVHMMAAGLENVEAIPTEGHPMVCGE